MGAYRARLRRLKAPSQMRTRRDAFTPTVTISFSDTKRGPLSKPDPTRYDSISDDSVFVSQSPS
jgi:hypothetical protein